MESSLVLRSPCALNVAQENSLTHIQVLQESGAIQEWKIRTVTRCWTCCLSPELIWGKLWVKFHNKDLFKFTLTLADLISPLLDLSLSLITWVNQGVRLLLGQQKQMWCFQIVTKTIWTRSWTWLESLCDGPQHISVCVCGCAAE